MKLLQRAFAITLSIVTLSTISTAQSQQHKELVDDKPAKRSKQNIKTTPAYTYFDEHFFMTQVNVTDDGLNIVSDAANEPSIAFDYTDPNKMVIGWRQFDHISSNFRQAGYGVTIDGGIKWYSRGPIDPGVFRSDPVLDSDSKGNFYYNSLTVEGNNDFVCDVYKSTDGGVTWDEGVDAQGGDKQWMIIDKTSNPSSGHIYAIWRSIFSHCGDKSFTRSVDRGNSFEECTAIPGKPYWGTMAIDKNSDLYIGGRSDDGLGFIVVKSSSVKYSDSTVTFQDPVEVNMNGNLPGFGGPNPAGITGQIYVATDTSDGEHSGNVYLLATVENDLTGDPADIHVAASTDGGETWLDPVRVNQDSSDTNWQWFGDMSVAPNGRIDVVWLDTRNSPSNAFHSELFYSFSLDGGQTWHEELKLSESFDPHVGWPNQNKMGDYFDMVSDEQGAHLAWAATFNGEQDVYYGRIRSDLIISNIDDAEHKPNEFTLDQNYPNPFNPTTTISFSLPEQSFVEIKVHNTLGEEVAIIEKEMLQGGSHQVVFNARDLSSGVYFYTLNVDGKFVESKKMTLLK